MKFNKGIGNEWIGYGWVFLTPNSKIGPSFTSSTNEYVENTNITNNSSRRVS